MHEEKEQKHQNPRVSLNHLDASYRQIDLLPLSSSLGTFDICSTVSIALLLKHLKNEKEFKQIFQQMFGLDYLIHWQCVYADLTTLQENSHRMLHGFLGDHWRALVRSHCRSKEISMENLLHAMSKLLEIQIVAFDLTKRQGIIYGNEFKNMIHFTINSRIKYFYLTNEGYLLDYKYKKIDPILFTIPLVPFDPSISSIPPTLSKIVVEKNLHDICLEQDSTLRLEQIIRLGIAGNRPLHNALLQFNQQYPNYIKNYRHPHNSSLLYEICNFGYQRIGEHSLKIASYLIENHFESHLFATNDFKMALEILNRAAEMSNNKVLSSFFKTYQDFCKRHINTLNENGESLLYAACKMGNVENIIFLCEQGAEKTQDCLNALFSRDLYLVGSKPELLAIINEWINPEYYNLHKEVLLQYLPAVLVGQIFKGEILNAAITPIVKPIKNPADINTLAAAIEYRNYDAIQFFEENAEFIKTTHAGGHAALMELVLNCQSHDGKSAQIWPTFDALLKKFKHIDINARNNSGDTVLHLAVFHLDFEMRCVSSAGIPTELHAEYFRHQAPVFLLLQIIKLLLSTPKIRLDIINKNCVTVLDYLISLDHFQDELLMCALQNNLLDPKKTINTKFRGRSALPYEFQLLHHAITWNLEKVINYLLDNNIFQTENDSKGYSPFLELCYLESHSNKAYSFGYIEKYPKKPFTSPANQNCRNTFKTWKRRS